MKNSRELISSYLSKLSKYPLLSKNEEIEIAKKLDKNETTILRRCAGSPIFLTAVLVSKKKLNGNPEYLCRLLKTVDENSTEEIKKQAYYSCKVLYIQIQTFLKKPTKKGKANILSSLLGLAFTNFAITSFIKPLGDLCKTLKDFEKRTARNFKMLRVKNQKEYNQLVLRLYQTSRPRSSKQMSCLNDQEEIMNFYQQNNITERNRATIKKLGTDIIAIKKQVEKDRFLLIMSNLRLVVSRVKCFLNKGLPFDDLIQEGNIGLMKAIDKFDWQRGIKFGTYATWWIDQTIQRGVSNKSREIRIPIYLQDLIPKVEKAVAELEAVNGKTPTIEEICKHSELTKEQVSSIIVLISQPISIETQISQDLQLKDIIVDPTEDSEPFSAVSKKLLKDKIREVLEQLPEKHQKILRLRFGIGESRPLNLSEIGQQVGLTKERIRQIESEGLQLLKKKIKKEKCL